MTSTAGIHDGKISVPTRGAAPSAGTLTVTAILLFVGLFGLYVCDGNLAFISDAWTSMLVAESLIHEGNLSLSEDEVPWMQRWVLKTSRGAEPVPVTFFDAELDALRKAERLVPDREGEFFRDMVVPTSEPGIFANTFAPGAGITAVPFFAVANTLAGDLSQEPGLLFTVGKLAAAACVAASAVVFLFLVLQFVPFRHALLLTLAYALATGVWSTSSQALWQHGPNELFLTIGTFLLVGQRRHWRQEALAGVALAAATWCRPTSVLVVICVALHLWMVDRRRFLAYTIAGLPFAVAMLVYNYHYFGSPLSFGQTEITVVAEFKTGNPEIWQTPLWLGLAGLLFSPSRGLFVFSPFLLFAIPGIARIWKQNQFAALRPFTVAVALILCLEAKHFDWWGGWSYGYRHIVDTAPFWCLFLVPVIGDVLQKRILSFCFVSLLAWSFVVQAAGAFLYDFGGWNDRLAYRIVVPGSSDPIVTYSLEEVAMYQLRPNAKIDVITRNVDLRENQPRLWSLSDSQILYYLTHARQSRAARRVATLAVWEGVSSALAKTHREIARIEMEQGDLSSADRFLSLAFLYDPTNVSTLEVAARLAISKHEWDKAETHLRSWLDISPNSPRGTRLLGKVLMAKGNQDAAGRMFQRAIELGEEGPELEQDLRTLRQSSAQEIHPTSNPP